MQPARADIMQMRRCAALLEQVGAVRALCHDDFRQGIGEDGVVCGDADEPRRAQRRASDPINVGTADLAPVPSPTPMPTTAGDAP